MRPSALFTLVHLVTPPPPTETPWYGPVSLHDFKQQILIKT